MKNLLYGMSPAIRTGAIIGAAAGLLITIGADLVRLWFSGGGEMRVPGWYAYLLWALIALPALTISKWIGLHWIMNESEAGGGGKLLFVVAINSLLCTLLGGIAGHLLSMLRNRLKNYESDKTDSV